MSTPKSPGGPAVTTPQIESIIRIALLVALLAWCAQIVAPFVTSVLWAIIIAVAVYPWFMGLERALGGRHKVAMAVFCLFAILVLVLPTIMLGETVINGVSGLVDDSGKVTVRIPPPPAGVNEWPIIGAKLGPLWQQASADPHSAIPAITPHLRTVAEWLVSRVANASIAMLEFLFGVVVAGVLVGYGQRSAELASRVLARLAGTHGAAMAGLAEETIRVVTRGILGVALIQSILAGVGFLVIGLPAAGLWALGCLVLSVVQLGTLPVMIPAIIYVFSTADTLPAVAFMIWAILVGLIDNVLKPIFFNQAQDIPVVVIFIGAIGGLAAIGMIGLFVGAVILVLGHRLFTLWLQMPSSEPAAASTVPAPTAEGQSRDT